MLRLRSGEGRAAKPSAVDEAALAEMGQVVADARAEITRLVQLGELQNDPIRHPIQALSVHLEALYKVTQASSQVLAKQLQLSGQEIETRLSMGDNDLCMVVNQNIAGQAGGAERGLSVRDSIVGAGLSLAAVLIGASAGYWIGQTTEAARFVQVPPMLGVALTGPDAAQWVNLMRLNDIGKAERVCRAQAGGLTCAISFWVSPPTANSHSPQP
jgi:hypothetical protein